MHWRNTKTHTPPLDVPVLTIKQYREHDGDGWSHLHITIDKATHEDLAKSIWEKGGVAICWQHLPPMPEFSFGPNGGDE